MLGERVQTAVASFAQTIVPEERDYMFVMEDTAAGRLAGVLHDPREREQIDVRLRLPEAGRSSTNDLLALPVLDEHGRLAGVITVDDVMDVVLRKGRRRVPLRFRRRGQALAVKMTYPSYWPF